jgi:hypothetical protein
VFALAVTASVQLVGVYLVFSSLIIPALATSVTPRARRVPVAYAIGALGYALGLALSALLDLPSGAVIVWTLAACGLVWRAIAEARATRAVHASGRSQTEVMRRYPSLGGGRDEAALKRRRVLVERVPFLQALGLARCSLRRRERLEVFLGRLEHLARFGLAQAGEVLRADDRDAALHDLQQLGLDRGAGLDRLGEAGSPAP